VSVAPTPAATRPLRAAGMLATVLAVDLVLLAIGVGGVGALLHHARALALFAEWVAGSIALATLRGANRREPVVTRREPGVMLLLVLVPAVTPCLSAWAERAGLAPLPGGAALRWGGVALAGLGFALRIAAIMRLGQRFSPVVELQRQHALETTGVYGRVRHPGYLGAWISNLGVVLAFGSAAALPLAVLMAVALGLRIRSEEQALEQHFGEAWRRYRERTGALVPRPAWLRPPR
jgi:protein-S-isoprenylcysteine O-methyltransferase Ste14